jgi:hypothetical protein
MKVFTAPVLLALLHAFAASGKTRIASHSALILSVSDLTYSTDYLSPSTSAPDEEVTPARALASQCTQDVRLLNVVGSSTYTDKTGDGGEEGVIYDNIPIVIESQDELGTVQFKLNTDEFSSFFKERSIEEVWMQYHSIDDEETSCISKTMVPFPSAASETFTAKCVRNEVALVQLWVVDSGLSDADNAEVDHCCRKPDTYGQSQPPAVQYTFVLHCETSCDPPPASPSKSSHGVCENFAVHARASVSFDGEMTTIHGGDVGVAPGTSITGSFNIVDGQTFKGTSDMEFADSVLVAYNEAIAKRNDDNALAIEIGGATFTPGTYRSGSAINIRYGTNVTLDGGNDENAEFLFQAGSTLVTAADTYITLINGAKAENVMWALGSAATLGADSVLEGSILAGTAITFGYQSELHGCALAQSAVTFESKGSVKGMYYIDGVVSRTRYLRG